jgi:hypothetical protein
MMPKPRKKLVGRPCLLTDELKYLMTLSRYHGYSYNEIAYQAGVSSSTVWRYLSAGETPTSPAGQRLARLVYDAEQRSRRAPNLYSSIDKDDEDAY